MNRLLLWPLLVSCAAAPALAQSATQTHHAAVHHASAAVLPPNIPPVHGILHTEYSLKYIDIRIGTGELAQPRKYYTVQYTGWLAKDGTKFDSSLDRGQPFTFPVGAHRVIPGWDTGFEGMRVGGKRRLFIPYQLAYGDLGRGPIPPKANLIFDVELLSQSDMPPGMEGMPMPPRVPRVAPPPPPAQPQATPPPPPAQPQQPAQPPSSAQPQQPEQPQRPAQPEQPQQPQG